MSTTADFATIDIDGLANKIQNVDAKVIQSAKDFQDGAIGVNKFKDSANVASTATTKLSSSFKTLGASIISSLIVAGITAILSYVIKEINDYINRLDIAKDKLEETTNELESIDSELESISYKIKDLENSGPLSLTDKEELERLKEENAELEKRKQYLEMQKQEESKDVVKYAKEKMDTNYGRETSREDIDAYKKYMDNSEAYGSFYYEDDPLTIKIAQYEKFKEQRKQAIENDDWEAVELLDQNLKNIEESLIADRTELQGFRDDLSLTGESSEELDNVNNKLKFIDDLLLSPGQNLVNFIDNDITDESKDKLVKLAEEGQLTSDVLKKSFSDVDTYLAENGLTIEDLISILGVYKDELSDIPTDSFDNSKSAMIDLINSMSDGFDVLDDVYADVFDKGSFDFTKLDSKKFEEAFKDLKPQYEEFIETVSESPNDINACQEAFDKLATAFIDNKGVLKNLTEENANVAISMLRNMGIANAEEIVMAQLAYNTNMVSTEKAFLAKYSHDVANATIDEVTEFLAENEVAETVRQSMAQLALSKISVNEQTIDTSKDIDNMIALANAAGASALALAKLEEAKAILNSESDGSIGWLRRYEAAEKTIADIESGNFDWGFELLDPADFKVTNYESYKPKYTGGDQTADARTKAAEEAAKDAKDAYGDMFDFFERRVKVLEDAFGNLEAGIENVLGADAKNTLLSAQLGILDEEVNNYTDALAMYKEQANNVLSTIEDADLREKIVDGSVSLVDLQGDENETVKAALDAYSGWADKVAECTQKLEELKTQIRQLELEKFNNIVEDFTDQFDIRGTAIDNIDKQIALLEESGELVGKGYYEEQITQAQGQLSILENQKAAMVKSLADAINSGRIQKGTDEWQEMVTAIQEIDGSIIDCKTDIEKFNNSIQEIDWSNFERVQDVLSGIHDELGNLAGLFDDANDIAVSDGKGNWTNEAIATMGLHAQQYETAKYQIEDYANKIAQLEQDYADGKYSATEYIEKLGELKDGQWAAVDAMEAAEDVIISLNEKRIQESIETINKEIDAYKELVDAKLEALDAEKDLHDYRKSIAEKSKSITDIEKQLAAMSNDDSLAARAKKAQLQEQLAEARKDLEEEEYNHSIDSQKDALSKQAEDYEAARQKDIEKLEESLKNREALLLTSFNTVKNNAILVGQEILAIAQQHGVNVDSVITTSWTNGSNAVASYGATLTTQSSSFIGNLSNVESQVYSLQTQADNTSYSISSMFGQSAETLLGQLSESWTSTDNLNTMTGTLQNSLINTLERGYDISAITGALNSIESAANAAAEAVNRVPSSIPSPSTNENPKFKLVDTHTNQILATGDSWSELNDIAQTKYFGIANHAKIEAYAKGSKRIDEDQLAWTDEHGGREMIIRRSDGAILTRLEKNDAIANANLAENLFKWGEINPNRFMQGLGSNTTVSKINVPMKESKPNITLDYDLNIGSFTDGEHLLSTIQKVSKESATKLLNDINRDVKIRGR